MTEMVTQENWKEYSETDSLAGFQGYLRASEELLLAISTILEKDLSFEELKAELTQLHTTRYDFVMFAESNLP